MQIQPTTSSPLANLAAAQPTAARLVAGDASTLPVGALLAAAVTKLENNEVTLNVAGKLLTIRTGLSLAVGDSLSVALAPNGTLEIARPVPNIDSLGAQSISIAVDPATESVNAILRGEPPPPLGESLPALRGEIANQPKAAKVNAVLDTILPDASRPTNAEELTALVKDGGQFLEAKLDRRASGEAVNFNRDLKAVLAELVAVAPQLVAARSTLDGIEYQQAANALAQQSTGAFVVPIPFPDGANWRTLHLAIEPEAGGTESETPESPSKYRMLMHVPLAELGETYVEAGVEGGNVRAVLYLDSAVARDRLRADLPMLEADLRSGGFESVLLDIRPASDLPERRRQRADAMKSGRADRTSVVDVRV